MDSLEDKKDKQAGSLDTKKDHLLLTLDSSEKSQRNIDSKPRSISSTKRTQGGELSRKKSRIVEQQQFEKEEITHQCVINNNQNHNSQNSLIITNRCQICGAINKLIFYPTLNNNQFQNNSQFNIIYMDYTKIFSRKMECHTLPPSSLKYFLHINSSSYLRKWALFVLERPTFFSIDPHPSDHLPSILSEPSTTLPQFTQDPSIPSTISDSSKYPDEFSVLGNFEGANIGFCAINKEKRRCSILLRSDTNTKGCLHWFRFNVRVGEIRQRNVNQDVNDHEDYNSNDGMTVTFSLLNNQRSSALYRQGMQVAVLDSTKPERGWHRAGQNIFYYRSNVSHQYFQQQSDDDYQIAQPTVASAQQIAKLKTKNKHAFHTMDFNYTFTSKNQEVSFAYCFPYTLSTLVQYLENQEELLGGIKSLNESGSKLTIANDNLVYKRRTIAVSRLNLPLFELEISSPSSEQTKTVIYIIARQHPGESPSSFVCQGIISFLLKNTRQSAFLLSNHIFKIIPMMNPDGVAVGNSRCNLSGADLNRKWDNPDPVLHPEVFTVKKRLKKLSLKREISIFCDLHGHSAKKHAFFYGCNRASEGGVSSWTKTHLLPRIFSRITQFFSLQDCKFRVTEDKKNTARVVVWSELKVDNSFTLETSFFGYDDSKNEGKPTQFTIQDLESLGENISKSFMEYSLLMDGLTAELTYPKDSSKMKNMKSISRQNTSKTPEMVTQAKQSIKSTKSDKLEDEEPISRKRSDIIESENEETARKAGMFDSTKRKAQEEICPGIQKSWREYFSKDEIEKTFKRIEKGEDPNDNESISGSDSEPELDIFKPGELPGLVGVSEQKNIPEQPITNLENENQQVQLNSGLPTSSHSVTRNEKVSLTESKKGTLKKETKRNYQSETRALPNKEEQQSTLSVEKKINDKKQSKEQDAQNNVIDKTKWKASPFIQSYKMQLEIKKQQFKKQSYPIAKVGQNFDGNFKTHKNNPSTEEKQPNFQVQQAQLQQEQQQQQQLQSSSQQQQQEQLVYQQLSLKRGLISSAPKTSVNQYFLERRLQELQAISPERNPNISKFQQFSQSSQSSPSPKLSSAWSQVTPMSYPLSQIAAASNYSSSAQTTVTTTTTTQLIKSPKTGLFNQLEDQGQKTVATKKNNPSSDISGWNYTVLTNPIDFVQNQNTRPLQPFGVPLRQPTVSKISDQTLGASKQVSTSDPTKGEEQYEKQKDRSGSRDNPNNISSYLYQKDTFAASKNKSYFSFELFNKGDTQDTEKSDTKQILHKILNKTILEDFKVTTPGRTKRSSENHQIQESPSNERTTLSSKHLIFTPRTDQRHRQLKLKNEYNLNNLKEQKNIHTSPTEEISQMDEKSSNTMKYTHQPWSLDKQQSRNEHRTQYEQSPSDQSDSFTLTVGQILTSTSYSMNHNRQGQKSRQRGDQRFYARDNSKRDTENKSVSSQSTRNPKSPDLQRFIQKKSDISQDISGRTSISRKTRAASMADSRIPTRQQLSKITVIGDDLRLGEQQQQQQQYAGIKNKDILGNLQNRALLTDQVGFLNSNNLRIRKVKFS